MAGPCDARALYLGAGRSSSYGVHHRPGAAASGLGVLFCAPFGWDDIASYTSRRQWASQLASSGHDVLRFDLPGTGDSAGSPPDRGLFDAWTTAVGDGTRWLRDEAGCSRIALVGLGLGGLIARGAMDRGVEAEDLVLWSAPATGRAACRRLQAVASLQSDRLEGDPGLPEGWLEVGGYVVSAATLAELARVDPEHLGARGLRRALVLDADGTAASPQVADQLAGLGAEVTRAPGPGYEAMVEHPQTTVAPDAVMTTVAAWLSGTSPAVEAVREADARASHLILDDGRVRETPVTVPGATGPLQGILAEPVDNPGAELGGILFNAGALRRVGPNRLWVETARSWAARGVPTLRVDLGGIGDSQRTSGGLSTPELYTRGHHGDAQAALAWLLDRPGVGRVVVGGLCSGGHDAFHVAVGEPRVATAVVANATALHFDASAVPAEHPPGPRALLSRTGAADATIVDRTLGLARWAVATLRNEVAFRRTRRPIERHLTVLRAANTRVILALCRDEPEQLHLGRGRNHRRLQRWPNVVHVELPGTDHTLRPVLAQRALRTILDEAVQRELSRNAL